MRRVLAFIGVLGASVPVYLLSAAAANTVLGEQSFLRALLYEGKRHLLPEIWATAIEAAPAMLMLALAIVLAADWTARRQRTLLGGGLCVAMGIALGLGLGRFTFDVVPAFAATALALWMLDRFLARALVGATR